MRVKVLMLRPDSRSKPKEESVFGELIGLSRDNKVATIRISGVVALHPAKKTFVPDGRSLVDCAEEVRNFFQRKES